MCFINQTHTLLGKDECLFYSGSLDNQCSPRSEPLGEIQTSAERSTRGSACHRGGPSGRPRHSFLLGHNHIQITFNWTFCLSNTENRTCLISYHDLKSKIVLSLICFFRSECAT